MKTAIILILLFWIIFFANSFYHEHNLRLQQVGELQELVTHQHMRILADTGQLEREPNLTFKQWHKRLFGEETLIYTDSGYKEK